MRCFAPVRHNGACVSRLSVLCAATLALAGCGATVADRPCPRVTEFPPATQARAADELASLPPSAALPGMLDAMASDRAFNRAICR
jgi:hypothetical protein